MAKLKWIPMAVVEFSLKERKVNTFKVYTSLKVGSDGYAPKSPDLYENLYLRSGFCQKTIKKHLKELLRLNWIGEDSSNYYLRSIWQLNNVHYHSLDSVEFSSIYLNNWKAYLIGGYIGYLARVQKRKVLRRHYKAKELIRKGDSYQKASEIPSYFPVSHKSLTKLLKVSQTVSHNYKRMAYCHGFIEIKKNFSMAIIEDGWRQLRKYGFEEFRQYRGHATKIYKRNPDLIRPNLVYRRGKKVKYKKKGI